jgi:hypothetical protein
MMPSAATQEAEGHIGDFLSRLFDGFEREGIDYAVARDYEALPRSLNGRDLDILITDTDYKRAYGILQGIAASLSAKLFSIVQEADTFAWAFVVHCKPPLWGIHIDFLRLRCNNWRGCYFVDETAAMARKVRVGGISTLRSDDIVFMQFCRDIVGRLSLREKYHRAVQDLYHADPATFERELGGIFGRRYAARLAAMCRNGDFGQVGQLSKRLRRAIIVRNLLRRPMQTAKELALYAAWRCAEYVRPNGIIVAIVGSDLAVRRSLTAEVCQEIYRLTRSQARVYRRTPGLLRRLSDERPDETEGGACVAVPPMSRFLQTLPRMFRIPYDALSYVLGYWLLIRPYLGRKCLTAIVDGHLHDFLVDPAQARGVLAKCTAGVVNILVPKPDVIIALASDPPTVDGWQSGRSLEESGQQRGERRGLAEQADTPVWLDTSGSREHAVHDSVRAILGALERRLGKQ